MNWIISIPLSICLCLSSSYAVELKDKYPVPCLSQFFVQTKNPERNFMQLFGLANKHFPLHDDLITLFMVSGLIARGENPSLGLTEDVLRKQSETLLTLMDRHHGKSKVGRTSRSSHINKKGVIDPKLLLSIFENKAVEASLEIYQLRLPELSLDLGHDSRVSAAAEELRGRGRNPEWSRTDRVILNLQTVWDFMGRRPVEHELVEFYSLIFKSLKSKAVQSLAGQYQEEVIRLVSEYGSAFAEFDSHSEELPLKNQILSNIYFYVYSELKAAAIEHDIFTSYFFRQKIGDLIPVALGRAERISFAHQRVWSLPDHDFDGSPFEAFREEERVDS